MLMSKWSSGVGAASVVEPGKAKKERCRVGVEKGRELVLEWVVGCSTCWHKLYSYGSRLNAQKNIFRFHGVWMSVRTISRRLTELDKMGLVKRTVRNPMGRGGVKKWITNMYQVTVNAFKWLEKQAKHYKRKLSSLRGTNMAHYSLGSSRRDLFRGCEFVEKVLITRKDGTAKKPFRVKGEPVSV